MACENIFKNLSEKVRSSLKLILMGEQVGEASNDPLLPPELTRVGNKVAFINCNVFDGESSKLKSDTTILVDRGKIIAVGHGGKIAPPDDYFIVDAAGRTVMPGLIDSHVHLSCPFTYEVNIAALRQMRRQIALNHMRTVYSGVTTVCDMGGPQGIIKEFKKLSDGYTIPGPRSLNCFTLISPRRGRRLGYPTQVNPLGPFQSWLLEGQVATRPKSISELKKACYKVKEDGGTHLKITYQSNPFSAKKLPPQNRLPLFPADWIKEIFRVAKETGMLVSIHSPFGAETEKCINLAIEIGAEIRIQHVCFDVDLDEITVKKMRDYGGYLIPTVMVYGDSFKMPAFMSWLEKESEHHLTPEATRQLKARNQNTIDLEPLSGADVLELDTVYFRKNFDFVRRNTQKAHAAGIIGLGTDLGGTYTGFFGRLLAEVQHYADFGIPADDILKCLTSVNAKINNLGDRGTVQAGKLADLIVLNGNPLVDITALADVRTVMKGGVFLKYEGVEPTSS